MQKYIVRFNTAKAKTSTRRRDWERQIVDDFIRAINGRQYECDGYPALMDRLRFIAGRASKISADVAENHVWVNNKKYGGAKLIPVRAYGFAQGYVDLNGRMAALLVAELSEGETAATNIPLTHFYDIRQRGSKVFKGCYVEVIRVA